ncbi:MAG: hypothetical protein IJU45_06325, partial [Clostridia bacterium]|nr:hypothetical protein [Clostridia bacterium]
NTNDCIYHNNSFVSDSTLNAEQKDNGKYVLEKNNEYGIYSINYPVRAWDIELKPEAEEKANIGKYSTLCHRVEHLDYYAFGDYLIVSPVKDFDGKRFFYINKDYSFPDFLPENIEKIEVVKTIIYCMSMQEQIASQSGDPKEFLDNYYSHTQPLKTITDSVEISELVSEINDLGSTRAFFKKLRQDDSLSAYWEDENYPLFYLRLCFKDHTVPANIAVYWY